MATATIEKGQKKVLVRKCIQELGLNTTYGAAKKWLASEHKMTLADATFYHVRQQMQREAKPVVANNGNYALAVELLQQAKKLVDMVGKDEAKGLIDLL